MAVGVVWLTLCLTTVETVHRQRRARQAAQARGADAQSDTKV
jgi:hypothetical protein